MINLKKSFSLALFVICIFTLSIPLNAVEKSLSYGENKDFIFTINCDIDIDEFLLMKIDVAKENFLKDLRQMTFATVDEQKIAIRSIFEKHFGLINAELSNIIHANTSISIDSYLERNSTQYWVSNLFREWFNANPNFQVPLSIFHSRVVNGRFMEGHLGLTARNSVLLVDGSWWHIGMYSGWLFPSGDSIDRRDLGNR